MTVAQAAQILRDRTTACVIYPTETVYGLAADALTPAAVERVFELKGRARDRPISLAVPNLDAVDEYARPTDRERAFMAEFLPGPVTVVVERRDVVPDVLTAGADRVGIRIPDHPTALALLDRVAPLTATSANRSGAGSARRVEAVAASVRDAADFVLDEGTTPGTESTVVDVTAGTIHRRGALAEEIEAWLAAAE
ncbi:L-threonylcarbamoyladenylate synthase [Halocatena pleomorpha]|uniref:L-threonylcarbamoyladenylate synthase n=1 Tax=Halocatena pleomorpha TaxID=1785090 RepID=A0A3P3RA27_9EURY|nr:L-threonylcarbamoyladenylate synthase [Halocatena pleomorpha]RRJ30352.1 threonylcarbamoyl-AMP synthase [Halocatena pleomorpha]